MARLYVAVCIAALAAAALAQESLPMTSDSTLDQCQVILGSQALGDGTFDRDTEFSAFVEDGSWSVPLSSILNSTGDVLYVVPASKSESFEALTPSTRKNAGFCYDTTTLLPQFNPLAVPIPSDVNGTVTDIVVSPVSTLLVFGTAYGLTEFTLDLALALDYSQDIATYNYIEAYSNDASGSADHFYRMSTKISNIVTVGATLLSNTSEAYASFAVLNYQAFGRKALNASSTLWNAHLTNTSEPALDLNDADVLIGIYMDAAKFVYATKDWLLPQQLNQVSNDQFIAAANAAANINQMTDAATDKTGIVKTSYYTQDALATMITELTDGSVSPAEFMESTSVGALSSALDDLTLPADAATTGSGSRYGGSTQAGSSDSAGSGMSGGAIAGTVIGVIAGVALIALVAGILLKRRSSSATPTQPSSGPQGMWRREQDVMNTNAASV